MSRLKQLRKSRGLKQSAIGEVVGVSSMTISRWEKGETQIKFDKAKKLADFFGVSVGYLLGFKVDDVDEEKLDFHNKILERIHKQTFVLFLDFLQQADLRLSDKQIDSLFNNIVETSDINEIYLNEKEYSERLDEMFSLNRNYFPTIGHRQLRDIYTIEKVEEQFEAIRRILED